MTQCDRPAVYTFQLSWRTPVSRIHIIGTEGALRTSKEYVADAGTGATLRIFPVAATGQ
jgi:hypothetical protein